MKAMLLRGPNTPFELVKVPDPTPGPGEAVAKVFACGSRLTIQHAKAGRRKIQFHRIIGHEITGEMVAVGAGVTSLSIGDAVTSYLYLNCGHCRAPEHRPRRAVRSWCGVGPVAVMGVSLRFISGAGRNPADGSCFIT